MTSLAVFILDVVAKADSIFLRGAHVDDRYVTNIGLGRV